jgi:hypothetical protein
MSDFIPATVSHSRCQFIFNDEGQTMRTGKALAATMVAMASVVFPRPGSSPLMKRL